MFDVKITVATNEEMDAVAQFIEQMNQKDEHHIGYCGTSRQEIVLTLKEELTDVPFDKSFLIASINESIIGVVGFDADIESNTVEVWGPFIEENYVELLTPLWNNMLKLLPSNISHLGMFPNAKNVLMTEWALSQPYTKRSEQTILHIKREQLQLEKNWLFSELTPEYFTQMKQLHDDTFPETYYNGAQIIERINPHRKVFIHAWNNELIGYIYVEVEPEFGEASIEFFSVKAAERSKGLGAALLKTAVSWIFTFKEIHAIRLCVDSSNKKAISLYRKVGFQVKDELNFILIKVEH